MKWLKKYTYLYMDRYTQISIHIYIYAYMCRGSDKDPEQATQYYSTNQRKHTNPGKDVPIMFVHIRGVPCLGFALEPVVLIF